MELLIGQNLKKLRRERDLTQEEVATHLGISFQAISKWERGDGYPDITILPSLANYFGVSVDDLIGMNEIAAKQTLERIHAEWEENRKNKRHRENVTLMKKALKTYPNNALLLVQLSASLERLDGSEEEKRTYLRESIAVQEQILRYCEDSEVRGAVLFNIADAYDRYGDEQKALEYAEKLPNLYKTRETALVRLLKDNKRKYEIAKSALEPLAWLLYFHLNVIAEIEGDPRGREKISKIFDILFDGEESEFVQNLRKKIEA